MTLLELAEQWETEAGTVRQIAAAGEYEHYWRGYAKSLESCADDLRARSTQEGDDNVRT